VATVHLSVRHGLRPVAPRGVLLRAAGGTVERWLLPGADAVIALTPSTARLLRVHFTGFVPHVQVPAVLQHVDLLVLPGLYEDLSSALIEAMAAGLPVVATRVGGTVDLVHHGVNGLLVPPPPRSGRAGRCDQPGPRRPRGGRPAVGRRAAHRDRPRLARPGPPGPGGLPARDRPRPQPLNGRHQAPGTPDARI